MTVANTPNVGIADRGIKGELGIIPAWAYVVAAVVFVAIPLCFFAFVWAPGSNERPPVPFMLLITFLPGIFLAFLALMVGYVNRDAGRRGMSRALWTCVVIFVPNAIGFILYFLMRSPIRTQCPKCGAMTADPRVNYCPSCGYGFNPTCPQCRAAVRTDAKFCANCGTPLAAG
jgi:ribosomal protein L37E